MNRQPTMNRLARHSNSANQPCLTGRHRLGRLLRAGLAACLVAAFAASADAQNTKFTYQGRLQDQGQAYTGTADYVFRIWNAQVDGEEAAAPVVLNAVPVDAGLFSTQLDFGAAPFGDSPRWLSVEVRTPAWNGQGAF